MNKGNVIVILVCISFLLCSFTGNGNQPKTIISGIIKTDGAPVVLNKITLDFPDYIGTTTKVPISIDSFGHFQVEIIQNHPSDFYINFGKKLCRVMFFASPGDKLFFEIDQNILKAGCTIQKLYSGISITGTNQKINDDIAKFNINLCRNIDWNDEEMSFYDFKPKKYKSYIDKRTKRLNDFVNAFNQKQNTCPVFQDWVKQYIRFWACKDLIQYVWDHPKYQKVNVDSFYNSLPKDYFNFLNELNIQNEKVEIASSYFDFVKMYYKKIDKDCFLKIDAPDKNFNKEYFSCFKDCVDKHQSQYHKDILYARFYSELFKSKNNQGVNSLYEPNLIKDVTIRMRIQKLYDDNGSRME